jgi:RNA polymerase sigma-70 factor (ECF subfamily)
MEDDKDESGVVDAARAGDQDAWRLLYRRLYPRLRAYLVRRVGSGYAEDAVSETMSRAVAGIDRFRFGPAGFDGWVFGIARRVAVDHHRHASRSGRQLARAVVEPLGDETGEALFEAEDQEQVRRAFELLSPTERELLELRVVAGLSAEEVAAVLGKRPGAIRTAQSRALAHLRRLIEDEDD